jgi:hypothetical protein
MVDMKVDRHVEITGILVIMIVLHEEIIVIMGHEEIMEALHVGTIQICPAKETLTTGTQNIVKLFLTQATEMGNTNIIKWFLIIGL